MSAPFPVESLIEDARALRGLARHLCADAATADDVLQTAVMRALDRPPRDPRSLRAWLARVVTNEARAHRRGTERRLRREFDVAPREATPGPGELAVRHEARVELIRAVQDLNEPYREVVLLRFFEGLPPRRIADRLGAPVKTIDSRIARALALLRAQLDERHDGDRRAWLAAIAPLAARPSTWTTLTGVLFMNVPAVVAGLVVVTATTWWIVSGTGGEALEPETAPGAVAHTDLEPPSPPTEAEDSTIERAEATEAPRSTAVSDSASLVLEVSVVDPRGERLAGVRVGATFRESGEREAVSDANGTVTFPIGKERAEITVTDDRYVGILDTVVDLALDDEPRQHVVVAAPSTVVAGRVLDGHAAPVNEAEVTLELPHAVRAQLPFDLTRTRDRRWSGTTTSDGRFRFENAPAVADLEIRAMRAGTVPDALRLKSFPALGVRLTLGTPDETAILEGIVYGPDGAPLRDVRVALGTNPDQTDELGRFRFEYDATAPPDRLTAVARGRLPVIRERGDEPWPPSVTVQLTDEPRALAGTVFSVDGQPLAGALVWIDEPTIFASWDDGFWSAENVISGRSGLQHRAETDDSGRFLIDGLVDREYGLLAMDRKRAWKIEAGRFHAGDHSIEVRFPDAGLHRQLVGRVVDRRGHPVPAATCQVATLMLAARDPVSHQEFYNVQNGSSAITDDDGRFTLHDIPIENSTLGVRGDGIAVDQEQPIPLLLPDELVIRVERSCRFRIDRPSAARAAAFRFVDGDGQAVRCVRRTDRRITHLDEVPLADGRSELLTTSDSATTMILLDDERNELERLRVDLSPTDLTIIR